MKKNKKNDWYSVFTGLIFGFLVFSVKSLFKIFWNRCKFIWSNRRSKIIILISIIVISITVYFIVKYNVNDSKQTYCLIPIPLFLFTTGCINKIIKLYLNEYSKIFENINFKARNGLYPKIIKKVKSKKDKKVREILIIKSLIPFNEWSKNKDLLESAFNAKIALKRTNNKQIIKLIKL